MNKKRILPLMILLLAMLQSTIFVSARDRNVINFLESGGMIDTTTERGDTEVEPETPEEPDDFEISDGLLPDEGEEPGEIEVPEDFLPTESGEDESDASEQTECSEEMVTSTELPRNLGSDEDGTTNIPAIIIVVIILLLAIIIVLLLSIKKDKNNSKNHKEVEEFTGTPIEVRIEMIVGSINKNHSYMLERNLIMGSDASSDVEFVDSNVEPNHAKLINQNGTVYLVDTSVYSGTYLCGMRIQEQNVLTSGDNISIGDTEFIIHF